MAQPLGTAYKQTAGQWLAAGDRCLLQPAQPVESANSAGPVSALCQGANRVSGEMAL